MIKHIFCIFIFALIGCGFCLQPTEVTLYHTTKTGTGPKAGTVLLSDTSQGLLVRVFAEDLPPGPHGFHIHEYPNCSPSVDPSGALQPAGQAGGHYDPERTGRHAGPTGEGHRGDLPELHAQSDGTITTWFYLPNKTVSDFKGRSVIIHANGDNYRDTPLPLGGGGERIACGIIH